MPNFVSGDRDRGQRLAVIISLPESNGDIAWVIVIFEIGSLFDGAVVDFKSLNEVFGQFAAGAGHRVDLFGVFTEYPAYPQLRSVDASHQQYSRQRV